VVDELEKEKEKYHQIHNLLNDYKAETQSLGTKIIDIETDLKLKTNEYRAKELKLHQTIKTIEYSVSKQENVVENYRRELDQTKKRLQRYHCLEESEMFQGEMEEKLTKARSTIEEEEKDFFADAKKSQTSTRRRSTLHGDVSITNGSQRVKDLWDMANISMQQLIISAAAVCETIVFQERPHREKITSFCNTKKGTKDTTNLIMAFEAPKPGDVSIKTLNLSKKLDEGNEIELGDLILLFEHEKDRNYFLSYIDYRHRSGQRFLQNYLHHLENIRENPRFETELMKTKEEISDIREHEFRMIRSHNEAIQKSEKERQKMNRDMSKINEKLKYTQRMLQNKNDLYESLLQNYSEIKPDAEEAVGLRFKNEHLNKHMVDTRNIIQELTSDKLSLERGSQILEQELHELDRKFHECSCNLSETTINLHMETDRADYLDEEHKSVSTQLSILLEAEKQRITTNQSVEIQFSPTTVDNSSQINLLDPENYVHTSQAVCNSDNYEARTAGGVAFSLISPPSSGSRSKHHRDKVHSAPGLYQEPRYPEVSVTGQHKHRPMTATFPKLAKAMAGLKEKDKVSLGVQEEKHNFPSNIFSNYQNVQNKENMSRVAAVHVRESILARITNLK